jgi:polar amino acid transport system substrate-binding protein
MDRMKKLFAAALALTMVLALAACAKKPADAPAQGGIATVKNGVLTVVTAPDFAPYEFYALDEKGEPHLAGLDMDLAQYIADYLGLELDVIPMDFDGTILELQSKKADLGMACYSPDLDRKDVMDFSDIYMVDEQVFLCLDGTAAQFADASAVNQAGVAIGVQVGSIQSDLAKEYAPQADTIGMAKVTDIVADLVSGKLDGAFLEKMVAESYEKIYPELCVAFEVDYADEGAVIGVYKGNEALLKAVNEALAAAAADGSMATFAAKAVEQAYGTVAPQ